MTYGTKRGLLLYVVKLYRSRDWPCKLSPLQFELLAFQIRRWPAKLSRRQVRPVRCRTAHGRHRYWQSDGRTKRAYHAQSEVGKVFSVRCANSLVSLDVQKIVHTQNEDARTPRSSPLLLRHHSDSLNGSPLGQGPAAAYSDCLRRRCTCT